MEIEFLDWYSKNEDRFAHGQFDEKQIAYSAWLDGKKRNSKAENLPISDVSDFNLEEMQKAVAYGFWYATESQNNGGVPIGNFLQWILNQRGMTKIPKDWDYFMKANGYNR